MIWQALGLQVRSEDIKLEKIHGMIIKAMIAAARAPEDLKIAADAGESIGTSTCLFPILFNNLGSRCQRDQPEMLGPGKAGLEPGACLSLEPLQSDYSRALWRGPLSTRSGSVRNELCGSPAQGPQRGRGTRARRGYCRPFLVQGYGSHMHSGYRSSSGTPYNHRPGWGGRG